MSVDTWIYDFIKWMLDTSKEYVKEKSKKLKERYKNLSGDELVDRIVFGEAIFADDIGITPALIRSIPIVGELVSEGLILPEVVSVTFRQVYCTTFIAALYNRDLDEETVPLQIMLVLGISTGMESVRKALVEAGETHAGNIVEKHFPGGIPGLVREISNTLNLKLGKTEFLKKNPLIAIPISAGFNYLNLCATGTTAKYYFNDLYFDYAELAHLELIKYRHARAVVSLMVYMAKADQVYRKVEKDIIEVFKESVYIPEKYREDFVRTIHSPPDWEGIKSAIKQKESKIALLIQLFLVMYFDNELEIEEVKIIKEVAEKLNISREDIDYVDRKTLVLQAYSRGMAFARDNNYEEALKCYNRALEIIPQDTDILNKKGNILYKQEKYDEAIACYDRALAEDDEDKFAWNNKGLALYNRKKYEEALGCFEKALEIDPHYKYAWSNKGLVLYRLEKYD